MRTIKLTIEYDGTDFCGWQVQKNTNCRTVQGDIEQVLEKVLNRKIRIHGSGRTDTGVHALGQVAHFKTATTMTPTEIQRALNGNLSKDVSITHVEDVADTFHAQYSAKRKTYRYCIANRQPRPALKRQFALHYPHRLNCPAMKAAAQVLIGSHDFRSFMAADAKVRDRIAEKNTVRTISRLAIRKRAGVLTIEIEANGFLYKMVRNIVGTLLEVGNGRVSLAEFRDILKKKDRKLAADTAPAHGLTLVEVVYE